LLLEKRLPPFPDLWTDKRVLLPFADSNISVNKYNHLLP